MANNSSGGGAFNKFLNFIGFVDEDVIDNYDDPEFSAGEPARNYSSSPRRQQPVRNATNYADHPIQNDRGYRQYEENRGNYRYQESSNPYITARPGAAAKPSQNRNARPDTPRPNTRSPYAARERERGYAGDEFSTSQKPAQNRSSQPPQERPRNNIVNMRPEIKPQTVIYYLHSLEQCRNVINDLIDNKTILLNLEDMDERYLQRGIDMLAGAAFALNATLRKASNRTYLIAPNSVEIAQTNDIERHY